MDVMVHLTTRDSGVIALALMHALERAGTSWECFVTNDGAELLKNGDIIAAMNVGNRAVVCEKSWDKLDNKPANCPIELGSQTINSAMMANAARVVSL